MKLAADFYSVLDPKITQIQLSGFIKRHEPLCETEQKEIITAIQDLSVPLIDEGTFAANVSPLEAVIRERRYVCGVIAEILG
jgi:hypothetical protein